MGARLYNSVTGLFTSRDPVEGGNTTSYAYPQGPVGMNDITGLWSWRGAWAGTRAVGRAAWKSTGKVRNRIGSFAVKHWRNGNIGRVVGGLAFGACAVASAGVCSAAGLAAFGVSAAKRYGDFRRDIRGGMSKGNASRRFGVGVATDFAFTRLPGLRGAKSLKGAHLKKSGRGRRAAPSIRRRWNVPKTRAGRVGLYGGYGASLWWTMK